MTKITRLQAARWLLATWCWRASSVLASFIAATLRDARPGFMRVVPARLSVRALRLLMFAGNRLAPEIVAGKVTTFADFPPEPGYE